MWKFGPQIDLSSINERVDALESRPDSPELRKTIDSINLEIASLRATSDGFDTKILALENKMTNLVLAVAEGIQGYEKSERRVQATIQRARKQFKERGFESPGLEAEAHDLRLIDGARGDEFGVPAVPPEVAQAADEASSVPGVTLEQLQRARGFR